MHQLLARFYTYPCELMTKTGLAEIIESLTTNEKRSFALNYSSKTPPNFVQVYQALEKNPRLNSKQIKQRVKNKKMNLSYEKNYLHKMLKRALRNFHEDSSYQIILHQNLADIEILYNKGLIRPCMEEIFTAKKLAEKYEAFPILLLLLHWELKCIVQKGDFTELNSFSLKKHNFEESLYEKMRDYSNAVYQKASLASMFMTDGLAKTENRKYDLKITEAEIRDGLENAKSFSAFLQYAEGLLFYYDIMGKMSDCLDLCKLILNKYDEHPEYRYLFANGYISTLGNFCLHTIFFDVSDQTKTRIYEYESLLKDKRMPINDSLRKEIKVTSFATWFDIYTQQGDFKSLLPRAREVLNDFPQSIDELRSDLATSVCSMVSITLLLNNDPKSALTVIDYALNRFKNQTRLDLYFCFQILYLIAQYDNGNNGGLSSLIGSVERYYKKKGVQLETPYVILDMLKTLIKGTQIGKKKLLQQYSDKLHQLAVKTEEDLFLGSTKILHWININM